MTANLTKKQEEFAVAYAKSGNATEAYRASYDAGKMKPETVHVKASELLANGKVTVRIAALKAPALRKAEQSVERSMRENACVAYSDVRRLHRPDGAPIPVHELDDDTAAAVASVEYDKDTGAVTKIKFWDKNAALDKSFKHLGLYERDNAQKADNLALQVVFVKPGAVT